METTKLVAFRIDKKTLGILDLYCGKRSYLNRSRFLNTLLKNVLECSDEQTLFKLAEGYDLYSANYSVKVLKSVTQP